ncbi:FadR family transcriptional regulator [Vibrio sp. HA2012]|uniref:FadR/GntR family transcriptional regulator n=1 Tax=Vibrio sp. HA2012 TaxID=1971595 RepID=UPI000C2C4D2E|nr:GntR family transcriptional regulator [Vibrio sp. HA2012]PJC86139.1 FadR family transcriptional regulator [Vibrio sp. HA2012]
MADKSIKDSLFSPAQVGRASEDIALQIESAILNETLLPGDSLPSERELQLQFGTGRGVIREAIRALKQKGLIEIRKGPKGGAFIKQVDVSNISESLALFLKQKHIGAYEIAEFRESVDQSIALLAMSRATDEQKSQLMAGIEYMENIVAQDPMDFSELAEADRKLNLLLAEMANNSIFEWVMHAMQQGFGSYDNNLYNNPDFLRQTVENWRHTAMQIINREPIKLQASISRHYLLLQECLEQRSG